MMTSKNIHRIGDINIIYYQKFIIVLGSILLLFSVILSVLSTNYYYGFFPLIIGLAFLFIFFLYTKVFSVKYDSEYFYLSNLIKKERINTSQFVEIRKNKFLDFLYFIEFKEKRFLFMIKSEDLIKNFFKIHNKDAEELTQEIKKTLRNNSL